MKKLYKDKELTRLCSVPHRSCGKQCNNSLPSELLCCGQTENLSQPKFITQTNCHHLFFLLRLIS